MRSREFAAIPLVVALLGFVGLLLLAVYTGPWAWILLVAFTLVAAGFLFWWYSKRHPHPSADDAPVAAHVDDGIFRVLVVADEGCSADGLRGELATRSAGRQTRALVIAPSLSSRLDRLTGDEQAYQAAQDHLNTTLESLRSHRRRGRRARRPARPDPGRGRRAARVSGRPRPVRDRPGGQRQPAGEGSRPARERPLRHPRCADRPRPGGVGERLDRRRAGADGSRGDALADDALVLGARPGRRHPAVTDRHVLLPRCVRRHARDRRRSGLRPRGPRGVPHVDAEDLGRRVRRGRRRAPARLGRARPAPADEPGQEGRA